MSFLLKILNCSHSPGIITVNRWPVTKSSHSSKLLQFKGDISECPHHHWEELDFNSYILSSSHFMQRLLMYSVIYSRLMIVPGFLGSGMFPFHPSTSLSRLCLDVSSLCPLSIYRLRNLEEGVWWEQERDRERGRDGPQCHSRSQDNLRCLWKEGVKEERQRCEGGL